MQIKNILHLMDSEQDTVCIESFVFYEYTLTCVVIFILHMSWMPYKIKL